MKVLSTLRILKLLHHYWYFETPRDHPNLGGEKSECCWIKNMKLFILQPSLHCRAVQYEDLVGKPLCCTNPLQIFSVLAENDCQPLLGWLHYSSLWLKFQSAIFKSAVKSHVGERCHVNVYSIHLVIHSIHAYSVLLFFLFGAWKDFAKFYPTYLNGDMKQ